MGEVLALTASEPILLALLLFGATFVAEDAATIAAGLLVARGGADPTAALAVVVLGTAAGDLALYAVGRWGARTGVGQWLRRRADVRRAEAWMSRRALVMVFAARFVPGLRLPVFTASGLVAAPLAAVASIVAVTTPPSIGLLFEVSRRAGSTGAVELAGAVVPLGLLAVLAAIALPPVVTRARRSWESENRKERIET